MKLMLMRKIILLVLCLFSLAAEAEKINGENPWVDNSTGLTWTRLKDMSWRDALVNVKNLNLNGNNDWRLPLDSELEPLMTKEIWIESKNADGFNTVVLNFNSGFIWTNVEGVSMQSSRLSPYSKPRHFPTGSENVTVYAVRGGDPTLLIDFRVKVDEILGVENAQALKEEKERKNREAIYAADQKKFEQALSNKSPKAMYLSAGTYARNDEQYRAKEIYQKIISRFPKSNWAVKASDQLSGFRRAEERRSQSSQSQQSTYYEDDKNASIKLTEWEEDKRYAKGRWSVRCDGGNSDGRFLGFVGLDGDGYYHGDTVDKSLENAVRFMIKNCN